MFEAKSLISLNGDVYFRLKSDYAKSFWPFIDSQNSYTYADLSTLSDLAGRDRRQGINVSGGETSVRRCMPQPRTRRTRVARVQKERCIRRWQHETAVQPTRAVPCVVS